MMLALVPTSDVPDVFNQLVENIPDTVQIDPLLGYFERTWIAGLNGRAARYPPTSWNQTDRVKTDLNRTNNYYESFNKTFSSVVGHAQCSPNNLQLPVCRIPGASINRRQDALLQTWSAATEAKEEIFGEGY